MFTIVTEREHVASSNRYQCQTQIEPSCLSRGLDELDVWLVAHDDECLQSTNCDFRYHLQLGCSLDLDERGGCLFGQALEDAEFCGNQKTVHVLIFGPFVCPSHELIPSVL